VPTEVAIISGSATIANLDHQIVQAAAPSALPPPDDDDSGDELVATQLEEDIDHDEFTEETEEFDYGSQ